MPEIKRKTGADTGKRIFDVSHPNKSLPSATSKAVLVTNRPLLQDPMVHTQPADAPVSPDTSPTAKGRISLKPLSDATEIDPVVMNAKANEIDNIEEASNSVSPQAPSEDAAPAPLVPDSSAHTQAPENAATAPEQTADTAQEVKTPVDAALADDATASADADKETERQEALTKLVESKQYFLSINSTEKRKARRFVALGVVVSLLLVVAWADIALDAGLVRIAGIKPPTHFFSN